MNRAAAALNRIAFGSIGLGVLGWGAQECLWNGASPDVLAMPVDGAR